MTGALLLLIHVSAFTALDHVSLWRRRDSCGSILSGSPCLALGCSRGIVRLVVSQEPPHHPGVLMAQATAARWFPPGHQSATVLKVRRIRHGGQEGGGRKRPNTRSGVYPLAHRMHPSQRLEPLMIVGHPLLQGEKLHRELPERLREQGGELGLSVLDLPQPVRCGP